MPIYSHWVKTQTQVTLTTFVFCFNVQEDKLDKNSVALSNV